MLLNSSKSSRNPSASLSVASQYQEVFTEATNGLTSCRRLARVVQNGSKTSCAFLLSLPGTLVALDVSIVPAIKDPRETVS